MNCGFLPTICCSPSRSSMTGSVRPAKPQNQSTALYDPSLLSLSFLLLLLLRIPGSKLILLSACFVCFLSEISPRQCIAEIARTRNLQSGFLRPENFDWTPLRSGFACQTNPQWAVCRHSSCYQSVQVLRVLDDDENSPLRLSPYVMKASVLRKVQRNGWRCVSQYYCCGASVGARTCDYQLSGYWPCAQP